MKNFLIALVCTLSFFNNLNAQTTVSLNPINGALDFTDFYNFNVSHSEMTETDYVIQAGMKIKIQGAFYFYSITTETLTCPLAGKSYTFEDFSDAKPEPITKTFDIGNFTGYAEITLRLSDPLDSSVIVAEEISNIILKDGVPVDKNKVRVIDEKLISIDTEYSDNYDTFFSLDDIFNVNFKNENGFEIRRDLNIVIENWDDDQVIFAGKIKNFCLSEGKTSLTKKDKKRFKIIEDSYAERTTSGSIIVKYFLTGTNVYSSKVIGLLDHYKFSNTLESYVFEGLNIAISYPEKAAISYPPVPEDLIFHLDENDEILEVEEVHTGTHTMQEGIHEAFGFFLEREDLNSMVDVKIIDKGPKRKEKKIPDNYREFIIGDFRIISPAHLYTKTMLTPDGVEQAHQIMVGIGYEDKIIFLNTYSYHNSENKTLNSVNMLDVLNSLEINGYKFHFSYDENEILQDVSISPGISTIPHSRKTWRRILQNFVNDAIHFEEHVELGQTYPISPERNSAMAQDSTNTDEALISYTEEWRTGYNSNLEDLVAFSNDSMQFSFGCHKGRFSVSSLEKTKKHTFTYEYNFSENTFFKADRRLSFKNINKSITSTSVKEETFTGETIFVNPTSQNIHFYTIVAGKYDLKEFGKTKLNKVVSWANGSEGKEEKSQTFSFKDINVVTPVVRSSNPTKYENKYNLTVFYDDDNFWLIRIHAGYNYEISDILNSVKVKGKQFKFSYHGNELIEVTEG